MQNIECPHHLLNRDQEAGWVHGLFQMKSWPSIASKVHMFNPLSAKHKMVKRTQKNNRQIADELFECVWPFCGLMKKI